MIPRFKPALDWRELIALFRPHFGAVGRFEANFADNFDCKEAVAFSYGRTALWAFLQVIGLKESEIIMPAYTCSVVAHSIVLSGNHPRFVDISATDFNMDLDLLEKTITSKTRAIVVTHLFGYAADIDRIESIKRSAEEQYGHKVWIIQDCAHSFGAKWLGKDVIKSGDVALFGLNISKMMTSIFGGMLTTNDAELAEKIRDWRDRHFRKPHWRKALYRRAYLFLVYFAFSRVFYPITYWVQFKTSWLAQLTDAYHLDGKIEFPPDFLDKMLDVEAAIGLVQLKKYSEIVSLRQANALKYNEKLVLDVEHKKPPIIEGSTYSHYVVLVADKHKEMAKWSTIGCQLGELIQYSVPELKEYEKYKDKEFPVSKAIASKSVNFPLTVASVDRIIDA
tara:strand:- start:5589 stop:6767 length:1179 start_codon:yes stop_codon:yes gene_type:complete